MSAPAAEPPPAAQPAATAASDVADRGGSPAEAQSAAETAAQKAHPGLSDEDARKIAKIVVAEFKDLGAFDKTDPTPAEPASAQPADRGGEHAPDPAAPPAGASDNDPQPSKRSFAQRYKGDT
jgi:hypothetical protein